MPNATTTQITKMCLTPERLDNCKCRSDPAYYNFLFVLCNSSIFTATDKNPKQLQNVTFISQVL